VLELRVGEDGTILLSGRFDASQVQKAKEGLDAVDGPAILDFSGLEYISSAGIGVILATYKRLLDGGHSLRLVGMSDRIRNVFQYAGLDRVFTIE
jgi:anti-sigma B factor antagonist